MVHSRLACESRALMFNSSRALASLRNGQHNPFGMGIDPLGSKPLVKPMHMLKTYIVEDSQVILENLIATLEELVPVEVVGTAEDESNAVQWLTRPSNCFDLVIIDIFLKSGSGLGVLRSLRSLNNRPHKLVVLSNYATQDMRDKCRDMGADRVFDKSNEIESLLLYCNELATDCDPSGNGPAWSA